MCRHVASFENDTCSDGKNQAATSGKIWSQDNASYLQREIFISSNGSDSFEATGVQSEEIRQA